MFLDEPKMEFVEISLAESTITTSGGTGGGQRCIASQVDSHECPDFETQTPWTNPEN